MRGKRFFSVILACTILLGGLCINVGASDIADIETRATGRFSMDIPANTKVKASSSFPLEAGEVVTIKASYTPFSASVDFGLLTPNGAFLYVNVTDGSVDQEIEVDQRGSYTLAVRNNSSKEISVSGFVNY